MLQPHTIYVSPRWYVAHVAMPREVDTVTSLSGSLHVLLPVLQPLSECLLAAQPSIVCMYSSFTLLHAECKE